MELNNINIDDEINLRKYWLVLKKHWKPALGTFSFVTISALLFALSRPSVYEAESKLLFKSDNSTSLTGLGESLGRIEALTFQANPLDTQVEIIQSNPVLDSVIRELNLVDENGDLLNPKDLTQNLMVQSVRGADIISISYKSEDPEMATAIANKIADIFIRNNIQENRSEATSARDFISAQLPKIEADLNLAEQNLRRFKESNRIVALEQEARLLVDASFDLQRQTEAAEAQISGIDSTLKTYQEQLNIRDTQFAIVLAALNQSEGVQQALQELQNVEEEIATMSAQFTNNSQAISRLNTSRKNLYNVLNQRINQVINERPFPETSNLQIGSLQADLIGEIVRLGAQKQALTNQVITLSSQINGYKQRMEVLPELESEQSELERDLEVAQTTYETLLARFQELQVAESQNIGTARIISPALLPENPTDSNSKMFLAAGVLVGTFLAIAMAFILDLLDGSLRTVNDIKESLGFPSLGIIPTISIYEEAQLYKLQERWIPAIITKDLPNSPISEAYRVLHANLDSIHSDCLFKSIVVTSSVPQEGKSEVAANLAYTMAQSGQKVLLIDSNLQRPIQHRIWNLTNLTGLKNLLLDELDIHKVAEAVLPSLSILPVGTGTYASVSVPASKSIASLITSIKDDYDLVILDAPPLLNAPASSIRLSNLTDAMLFVVRPGSIDANKVQLIKEIVARSKQRVLGMVINSVDSDVELDNSYYPSIHNSSKRGFLRPQDITKIFKAFPSNNY